MLQISLQTRRIFHPLPGKQLVMLFSGRCFPHVRRVRRSMLVAFHAVSRFTQAPFFYADTTTPMHGSVRKEVKIEMDDDTTTDSGEEPAVGGTAGLSSRTRVSGTRSALAPHSQPQVRPLRSHEALAVSLYLVLHQTFREFLENCKRIDGWGGEVGLSCLQQ